MADAELIAISRALDAILDRKTPQKAYIFVDSQAAIQKVMGLSEIGRRIRAQLYTLTSLGTHTTIAWVPSYTGIQGNEIADSLAKGGLILPYIGRPYISTSFLQRQAKVATISSWKEMWAHELHQESIEILARGLGTLYRKIQKDYLIFSLKARLIEAPRAV